MRKNAFTMIELVFVIVVLGILAAVALPRLGSTMAQAQIASAQGDVASIRASIASERQKNLVKGDNKYPDLLDANNGELFSVVLIYPISAQAGGGNWQQTAAKAYTYTLSTSGGDLPIAFTYDNTTGKFECINSNTGDKLTYCKKITQ